VSNKEPSEIEKVEARINERRMEYNRTKTTHEISRSYNLVNKMNDLNKKISLANKWLSEQRAAMEAARQ
jgi:hypothetical protein